MEGQGNLVSINESDNLNSIKEEERIAVTMVSIHKSSKPIESTAFRQPRISRSKSYQMALSNPIDGVPFYSLWNQEVSNLERRGSYYVQGYNRSSENYQPDTKRTATL